MVLCHSNYCIVKLFFCLLIALASIIPSLNAQLTPEQRIQDSVIGWWNNNQYDRYIKPATDPVKKKRIQQIDNLVAWMKLSYTPVGGLGTTIREERGGTYGAMFLTWNVSFDKQWTDKTGNFKPIPEENTKTGIHFNSIPASYDVYFLNAAFKDHYFTWPPDDYNSDDRKPQPDPRIHPNVYPFITRKNELNCIFLAPNNKLPFEPVTIGEYLQKSEEALPIEFEKKKKEIDGSWRGDNARDAQSRREGYAYQEKEFQRYRNAIAKWKEKYKNRLNEPAILSHMQPTVITEFFGDIDPFSIDAMEKNRNRFYPLYKITEETLARCRSDKPQWIAAWVPYESKENGNQLYEMYTAFTQNVNYEYIYNYFFDPAKVQGKSYTPADAAGLKARLANYVKNGNIVNNPPAKSLAPGVHFMDDFSANPAGSKPAGWYFRTYGKYSEVVEKDNLKWVRPGLQNVLIPTSMKKPLPENFSLEFDLLTDDFNARTGSALELYLSTYPTAANGNEDMNGEGRRLTLKITAGNEEAFRAASNYMGEISLEVHSTTGINKENHSEGLYLKYPGGEFTNVKKKVHVTLQLQNGEIKLLLNDKVVRTSNDLKMRYDGKCIDCKILAGAKIKTVTFKNITQDWGDHYNDKNVGVYISNVKVSKL